VYASLLLSDRYNKFVIDRLKIILCTIGTHSKSVIGNLNVYSRYVNTARPDLACC